MADSYNKKEREKKKRKKQKEKQERKERRKQEGKTQIEFMYVDENGNLSPEPPKTPPKEVKLEEIEIDIPKKEGSIIEESVRKGKVKFFNSEKGFGFIIDNQTDENHFVHINNIDSEIQANDKVSFELENGPKGLVAVNVQKL